MSTVQAVTLKFQTPSARTEGADQQWSCKFHLSGAAITSQADAETAALGLAAPILRIISSTSYLSGWLYYPANSTINTYQADYVSTDHPGSLTGYVDSSDLMAQQAEVCILLRVPTVPNSKGRMTYLFKYIHGVCSPQSSQQYAQEHAALVTGLFDTYNTGIDTANRIPVSPGGHTPSADWEVDTWLHTRQLRRGTPPKA